MNRAENIASLKSTPLDLLIIGGGIVGSGIARDAAMRGLRVALVEQHDFAFGTSSRSSRLLHGGLRYLAQGRIGLVREASVEKKILHHIAPHLAQPLPFLFPTYRGEPDWALWKLRIGVKLYDLLCGGKNLGRSESMNAATALQRVQGLNPEKLTGAVRYFDGLTNDARLVIDTLRSAEQADGLLFNYLSFLNATRSGDGWTCELVDELADAPLTVSTRCIVNATGPWADALPHSEVSLRLTKGIHIVVERTRLPVPDAVVMTEGKRILFAIPWGERVILGTTDTDFTGPPEDVRTEAADVDYVLRVVNGAFPQAQLKLADVISTWAGLRPLIADPHGRPSDISRSHQILNPEPGWWDVAGGKLTTYRLMAEQTIDRVAHHLDRAPQRSRTAKEPLLPPVGTDGISGITPPKCTREAVEHFCHREWAIHLDDVMVRRTGWHYYHREADHLAQQVADWMGELLHWTTAQRQLEMERYQMTCGRPAAWLATARENQPSSALHV